MEFLRWKVMLEAVNPSMRVFGTFQSEDEDKDKAWTTADMFVLFMSEAALSNPRVDGLWRQVLASKQGRSGRFVQMLKLSPSMDLPDELRTDVVHEVESVGFAKRFYVESTLDEEQKVKELPDQRKKEEMMGLLDLGRGKDDGVDVLSMSALTLEKEIGRGEFGAVYKATLHVGGRNGVESGGQDRVVVVKKVVLEGIDMVSANSILQETLILDRVAGHRNVGRGEHVAMWC